MVEFLTFGFMLTTRRLCQGIGGIALDEYCKEKKERIGTAYGCEMIRRLLLEHKR